LRVTAAPTIIAFDESLTVPVNSAVPSWHTAGVQGKTSGSTKNSTQGARDLQLLRINIAHSNPLNYVETLCPKF
jgi:hypothetical protein